MLKSQVDAFVPEIPFVDSRPLQIGEVVVQRLHGFGQVKAHLVDEVFGAAGDKQPGLFRIFILPPGQFKQIVGGEQLRAFLKLFQHFPAYNPHHLPKGHHGGFHLAGLHHQADVTGRGKGGANIDDYDWTDGVMKVAGKFMDAITLHYYTHPLGWEIKGSALDFDRPVYDITLVKAQRMEELINGHLAVMDKYDPEHRVGLIVDEWGTWFSVEPGTNPGFLYQQNTMRDAMVAALHLDIFNKHSDRVIMTNIAQIVNVLQSVILTEGPKMIKTPTYYVYDLYKHHQDATLLDSHIVGDTFLHHGPMNIPTLTQSASVDDAGVTHITVSNLLPEESQKVDIQVVGGDLSKVKATILTGEVHAHNTFDDPNAVHTVEFTDFTVNGDTISANLPACSVVLYTIG